MLSITHGVNHALTLSARRALDDLAAPGSARSERIDKSGLLRLVGSTYIFVEPIETRE